MRGRGLRVDESLSNACKIALRLRALRTAVFRFPKIHAFGMRENHRHPLSFSAPSVVSTSPFSSVHCVQGKEVRVVHFAFTGANVTFDSCPAILLPPTHCATQLARTNNLFKRSWLDRAFTGATSWKVDKCLGWGQTLHFKVRFTGELSEAQRVGGLHDCIKLAVTPAKIQAFT